MSVSVGRRVVPCLWVADMRRTLDFYIERLGFHQTGYFPIESDPKRTEVRRDDVTIMFFSDRAQSPGDGPKSTCRLYLFPDSVDRLADELREKLPFLWGPENTEFDMRELAVRDPDGYVLIFAEPARA